MAFDLGSGSTKNQLARVNTCSNEIIAYLYKGREAAAYQDALNDNADKLIDAAMQEKGFDILKTLQQSAHQIAKPDLQCGVATAAFREALNGNKVLETFSLETGIPLKVITQAEEAELGFNGVLARTGRDPMDVLVWDIGGGSMQLSYLEADGKHHVVNVPWGAIDFRDALIREQGRQGASSPNPVSASDALLASVLVTLLLESVPENALTAIKSKSTVVGIGGVHNFSINPRFGSDQGFSRSDIQQGLGAFLDKTDEQLGGGDYVSTRVSDVLLVMGVMELLDIPFLQAIAIDNTEALLLSACENF